jgi:hypothetical protein
VQALRPGLAPDDTRGRPPPIRPTSTNTGSPEAEKTRRSGLQSRTESDRLEGAQSVAGLLDSGGSAQCQLPRKPFGSFITPSNRVARLRGRSPMPALSARRYMLAASTQATSISAAAAPALLAMNLSTPRTPTAARGPPMPSFSVAAGGGVLREGGGRALEAQFDPYRGLQ